MSKSEAARRLAQVAAEDLGSTFDRLVQFIKVHPWMYAVVGLALVVEVLLIAQPARPN